MKLQEIQDMWTEDCKIDQTNLGRSAARVPELHAKYLNARPLKNEMDDVMNTDDDVIRMTDKLEYLKTVMYQLEQIIKSINSRTWDIKSAIEWYKFTNGGL